MGFSERVVSSNFGKPDSWWSTKVGRKMQNLRFGRVAVKGKRKHKENSKSLEADFNFWGQSKQWDKHTS